MITPAYSLTSTERILPRLALDFTTASLDSRVTFSRSGNTATVTNSSGAIVGVNADVPRFDYDPVTLICKGLLIEESRTNSLLNSDSLSTQNVTVTAAARTLSFYGTGVIVLSGVASATVTGTGTYPTRTTYTFTPTAGTLTLTVTGTVQYAQLEIGSFATSYIPTAGSAVTRNADVATMTGTNFSDWYNASEGSFMVQGDFASGSFPNNANIISVADDTLTDFMRFWVWSGAANILRWIGTEGGLNQFEITRTYSANAVFKATGSYKVNSFASALNASTVGTDTSGSVITSADRMIIGSKTGATEFMIGHIAKILYWPQRITNAEVQAFSK
jgi:hypothetical protein